MSSLEFIVIMHLQPLHSKGYLCFYCEKMSQCAVPTWTYLQGGRAGVHFTHAAVEP